MAGSSSSINTSSFKSVSIEKNLADFCECVKNLKLNFEDTGIPIDDDNIEFHRMCQKLEFLLNAGLKEKSGVFGFKAKTCWHYLCTCLAKTKKMHEGVRFVRGQPELKTPAGKLRTLIRFCLVHQCFADTLQQCVVFEDITKEFYITNSSPLLMPGLLSKWISSLYDLSSLQYDLSPTGYDLDVGWPTFARKQFGNNTWKTPSSVGGLSSSFLSSYDSQSVTSFRSGLLISSSPLPDGQSSSVVSMAGHSSDNEESVTSSPINSPTGMDNIQLLMDTVRQLTSDKEELQAQVDSLSQQLQQEKENGKTLEQRLQETIDKQECDVQQLLSEKVMQVKALEEELKATKFDRATKELERERENQAFQQQQLQLTEALERLKENETLIRSLQDQLGAISNRTREERGELDSQLRQLQLSLMTRNEECEGFVNELRSTVAEMDQLRTQYQKAEEALKLSQTAESKLRAEGKMLQDESLMLRDKIVQLIKEKDCLWQRSDRLLHLQRVQATGQWIDDGTIRDCQGCRTRFTLFVRRHHCRLCGRIFCHSCSDHWLKIASSSRPTRTCLECYAIHRQFSQPEAGQLNSIALPLADGPQVVSMAANTTTEFALISDVEIVQSLNESTYSNSPHDAIKDIRTAETRSFDSLIQNDSVVFSDTFVSAAMIYRVPLQVTKPGCSLHWKFKTDPKSIAFAVVGSEEPIDDEKQHLDDSMLTRVVVETTLQKSEVDFVEGSAILDHAGRYYVYFDNSYSRFSANKVTFHLSLSLPSATSTDDPKVDEEASQFN